jgi:hypothetical protein
METQYNDLISTFKDWDIVFVRNEEGITFFEKLLYKTIRFFTKSKYNHVILIREYEKKLYVVESTIIGFVITKGLKKFIEEQKKYKREFLKFNFPENISNHQERYDEIYNNKYNLSYLSYYLSKKHTIKKTNCFQSISYILGLEEWWKIKPNDLINYLYKNEKQKVNI